MRHAMPDAYKRAKGTLRGHEMHGERARAERAIRNVLIFPQLQDIPNPSVDLIKNGAGEKAYKLWCSSLLRANLLTAVSVGFAEAFALNEDKIHVRVTAGKEVSDRSLEIRRSILLKFDALNVDCALVADKTRPNKFARNGFPARRLKQLDD